MFYPLQHENGADSGIFTQFSIIFFSATFDKNGGVQCNMFQRRVFGDVVFAQDRSALLEHKKPQGSQGWLDRCLYTDLSMVIHYWLHQNDLRNHAKFTFHWGPVGPFYSFLRQILQRCRPKQFLWMTSEGNELMLSTIQDDLIATGILGMMFSMRTSLFSHEWVGTWCEVTSGVVDQNICKTLQNRTNLSQRYRIH